MHDAPQVASRTATSTAATTARYITVVFAVTLAVIMYIDRVTIAQAAPFIQRDLGLTRAQWGWALSTFAWAYALFEIPGGWLGDRLGPRRVLIRIVLWWSFFTAATGWAWGLGSLIVTQALFGMGEAGCFPNITRVLATWLPKVERERAQSYVWLASRWGGALTPLLVLFLLRQLQLSWRVAFAVLGAVGVVWVVAFYRWFRDDPATHPAVNEAELALLPPKRETATVRHFPIGQLLSHPPALLLCLQYGCLAYGWFFYVTWLPTYLREARQTALQLEPVLLALLTGLPLLFGGIGCLISGWLCARLGRTIGVTKARRLLAITGFIGASSSILLFIQIQDPVRAMFVLGLAGFFNDFVMPTAWASTMDVGGRYAGTVSGAMNMVGGIAGATSTLLVGYLLTWTQDWTLALKISASVYMLGAVCWLFLDPTKTIQEH